MRILPILLTLCGTTLVAPAPTPPRPSLIRSVSTSIKQKLDYWPEDLVEVLLMAYQDTRGFSDGEYFGRAQIMSDTIYEKTAKFRSAREIRRKLMSMDLYF